MNFWMPDSDEQKELDRFMDDTFAPPIDDEHMKQLLETPPMLCSEPENCKSREYSGELCKCIRSVFLHNSHYEHYKKLVKNQINASFVELISKNR